MSWRERATTAAWPLAVGAWLLLAAGRAPAEPPGGGPLWCRTRPAAVEVLDGDTVRVAGETVRLLAVDTPERGAPWFRGDQEPWASQARARVERALAEGAEVRLLSWGARDAHGRLLGHVLVDGRSLSVTLAAEGLAWPTVERYGSGGFPGLAAEVLRAARPPPFEPPWEWRRRHRLEVP